MEEDPTAEMLFDRMSSEQADDVLSAVSRVIRLRGGASDWTLQKTYYLACVESIEDRLVTLPDARFFSWSYGPWSKDLRQLVDMAASAGKLALTLARSKYQEVTRVYKWPRGHELPPMANVDDASFLDEFLARSADLTGEELTLLAKETAPYKGTEQGRPIDLNHYLESRRRAVEKLSNDETLAQLLASRGH